MKVAGFGGGTKQSFNEISSRDLLTRSFREILSRDLLTGASMGGVRILFSLRYRDNQLGKITPNGCVCLARGSYIIPGMGFTPSSGDLNKSQPLLTPQPFLMVTQQPPKPPC